MKFASGGGGANAAAYKEITRKVLASDSQTWNTDSFDSSEYSDIMVLINYTTDQTNADPSMMWNTTTSTDFTNRISFNYSSDYTQINSRFYFMSGSVASASNFSVQFWSNNQDYEKIGTALNNGKGDGNAGNYPQGNQATIAWCNTSETMDRLYFDNTQTSGSRQYVAGAEVIILGAGGTSSGDSFWEELNTTTVTGSSTDTIDTGAFTAKKYLWLQIFTHASSTGGISGADVRINSDGNNDYARQYSTDFGAEATGTNEDRIGGGGTASGSVNDTLCANWFFANPDNADKLGIGLYEYGNASAGTAPNSRVVNGKYCNNTQATSFQIINNGGSDFDVGSIVRVYGAD